jgi:hypothetical protein
MTARFRVRLPWHMRAPPRNSRSFLSQRGKYHDGEAAPGRIAPGGSESPHGGVNSGSLRKAHQEEHPEDHPAIRRHARSQRVSIAQSMTRQRVAATTQWQLPPSWRSAGEPCPTRKLASCRQGKTGQWGKGSSSESLLPQRHVTVQGAGPRRTPGSTFVHLHVLISVEQAETRVFP